jgi:hypothetical protein
MSKESKRKKESDPAKTEPKKKPVDNPFTILPSDEKSVDDEMNELFNEDKVEHKHGHAEPERD